MKEKKDLMSKSSKWGSDWTIKKLDAFKKYVEAYLTIMDANKNKYGWKTLYFDGFAGSGDRDRKDNLIETGDYSLLLSVRFSRVCPRSLPRGTTNFCTEPSRAVRGRGNTKWPSSGCLTLELSGG